MGASQGGTVRAQISAVVAAAIVASGVALAPAADAQRPSALSQQCKTLQAAAIKGDAAEPSGLPSKAAKKYQKQCPDAPIVSIQSIGQFLTYIGMKKVTSSDPRIVAIGKVPAGEAIPQYVVGVGSSTICLTPKSGGKRCFLVVVPKAVVGKSGGRLVNVGSGIAPGSPGRLVSLTSSDPMVATVGMGSDQVPFIGTVLPGKSTICATFTVGSGGCQDWTFVP